MNTIDQRVHLKTKYKLGFIILISISFELLIEPPSIKFPYI